MRISIENLNAVRLTRDSLCNLKAEKSHNSPGQFEPPLQGRGAKERTIEC